MKQELDFSWVRLKMGTGNFGWRTILGILGINRSILGFPFEFATAWFHKKQDCCKVKNGVGPEKNLELQTPFVSNHVPQILTYFNDPQGDI